MKSWLIHQYWNNDSVYYNVIYIWSLRSNVFDSMDLNVKHILWMSFFLSRIYLQLAAICKY